MARSSAGESALRRHLRVLDAFDTLHPFRTLSEIARITGMAPSTVHRLIGELCVEGLLEREPDRTYRLGVRLWEYAARTPGAIGLREVARPWMQAAHARIRQHLQLGVRSGTDVVFVDRISARDAVINATLIGGRIPLHASAVGLTLLAHAPASVVDERLAEGLRTFTPHTIRTASQLRRTLRRVRAEGVATTPGHIHEEATGIAVPVRGPDGSVYAALGAVVRRGSAAEPGIIEALRVAATGVSRDLSETYARGADDLDRPRLDAGVSERSWAYIEALEAEGWAQSRR